MADFAVKSANGAKPREPDPTCAAGPLHRWPWDEAPPLALKTQTPPSLRGTTGNPAAD